MAVRVSTNHFRILRSLQRTDVHISDNSQKLLANTSAHCKRKTDTNTKYMPSSLSNCYFPSYFLLLAHWPLSGLAHHVFADLPGHTHFAVSSLEGSRLPPPFRILLCSASSKPLKHLIKTAQLIGATVVSHQICPSSL